MQRPWKWLITALAVAVFVGALAWTARALSNSRLDRWHPGRSGDVVVLEKIPPRATGAKEGALRVRLEIPAASPADAALIPVETKARADLVGPRTFEMEVPVDRAKWESIAPGARLRAFYHLNVGRTQAFIATLYLDALSTQDFIK